MSLNAKAIPHFITARPVVPTGNNKIRTLGTSRGGPSRSWDYSLPTTRSQTRQHRNDVSKTSLSLKDITQFDLLSPFAVQKLTGDVSSNLPSVSSKQNANIKMLNVQLPRIQYTSLPRLALTKSYHGNEVREEARAALTQKLSRSQSELSLCRRDPNLANHDRPHTEGRITRVSSDTGVIWAGKYGAKLSDTGTHDTDINGNTVFKGDRHKSLKANQHEEQVSGIATNRKRETSPSQDGKVKKLSKRTAKTRRAQTAEKMANLSISEYMEVKADNRHISGQVWSQGKPKTAPDGSRSVRFNTSNDVFEYNP